MSWTRSVVVLFAIALLNLAHPALANKRPVEGIAAVVNDEVISLYDVDQRVSLFFATSGIENTPDVVDRLRAQVLRSLVDEKLQLQEAARVEIEITDDEIDQNMKQLAAGNSMSLPEITKFLQKQNVDIDTMRAQIEAELAWQQYVRRAFGGRVKIGDFEIEEQYIRAVQTLGQPRYLVREILLAADGVNDQPRVRALANEIMTQLSNGVDFGAVARQFSAAPSAASGGRVGWVRPGQLPPQIDAILPELKPGQVAKPIQTLAGLHIILLDNRQEGAGGGPLRNKYDLLQIVFPSNVSKGRVDNFVAGFRTCKAAQTRARELQASTAARTGLIELGQLSRTLHADLLQGEAGDVLPPRRTDNTTQVYIICDRKDHQGPQISREAIENNIYSQRVSMMSRRHLRDLRRDAVVEYR